MTEVFVDASSFDHVNLTAETYALIALYRARRATGLLHPASRRLAGSWKRTSTHIMRASTFSIVAFDPSTNELGVAVQSKFLAVGAVVPWVIGGLGAIATQAWANTSYGTRGLRLLEEGHEPGHVIETLTQSDEHNDERQIGIVDSNGRSASFTGTKCMAWAGGLAQDNVAVQGNILAGPAVIENMAASFSASAGCLADRLLAALHAGQRAGGDRRGQQSAALYVGKPAGGYGGFNDRYIDLRVDDHLEPIGELARLLSLHKLYFLQPAPEDLMRVDDKLGAEICALLAKAGMLARSNTHFNDAAQAALTAFMHRENLEERVRTDGSVDRQTLEYLRSYRAARPRRPTAARG